MKRLILSLILVLLIVPQVVSAHVLKTDGVIGAVMHIDPDDDPIAGSIATFYFEIKDTTGKFSPQNCNCRVDIYEGGRIIYSNSLFSANSANSINSPVFQYVFPQRDVYRVDLVGSPQTTGQFQTFNLKYDVRVDRVVNSTNNSQPSWLSVHLFHLIAFGVAFSLLVFAIIQQSRKKNG